MDLTNDLYNSISKYFTTLTHTGYKSDKEVSQLLVLSFIEDFLSGPFSLYVSEEDYKAIDKMLYCIYGSCMIPYPDYKIGVELPINIGFNEYRDTEDDILRNTELGELRVV